MKKINLLLTAFYVKLIFFQSLLFIKYGAVHASIRPYSSYGRLAKAFSHYLSCDMSQQIVKTFFISQRQSNSLNNQQAHLCNELLKYSEKSVLLEPHTRNGLLSCLFRGAEINKETRTRAFHFATAHRQAFQEIQKHLLLPDHTAWSPYKEHTIRLKHTLQAHHEAYKNFWSLFMQSKNTYSDPTVRLIQLSQFLEWDRQTSHLPYAQQALTIGIYSTMLSNLLNIYYPCPREAGDFALRFPSSAHNSALHFYIQLSSSLDFSFIAANAGQPLSTPYAQHVIYHTITKGPDVLQSWESFLKELHKYSHTPIHPCQS